MRGAAQQLAHRAHAAPSLRLRCFSDTVHPSPGQTRLLSRSSDSCSRLFRVQVRRGPFIASRQGLRLSGEGPTRLSAAVRAVLWGLSFRAKLLLLGRPLGNCDAALNSAPRRRPSPSRHPACPRRLPTLAAHRCSTATPSPCCSFDHVGERTFHHGAHQAGVRPAITGAAWLVVLLRAVSPAYRRHSFARRTPSTPCCLRRRL